MSRSHFNLYLASSSELALGVTPNRFTHALGGLGGSLGAREGGGGVGASMGQIWVTPIYPHASMDWDGGGHSLGRWSHLALTHPLTQIGMLKDLQ